jgi:hypothetical protein
MQGQQERRKEGRSPSYLGGRIITDRKLITIECVVRDTSGAGARVVVPNATLLPEQFELHIPRKNTAYRVRARWRRAQDLGVEIVPLDARDGAVPITMARRLRKLQVENADLRRRLEGSD